MEKPKFIRPKIILPGTEEERFAKHRERFLGAKPEEFNLHGINVVSGWVAFKRYTHDLGLYNERLKHEKAGI